MPNIGTYFANAALACLLSATGITAVATSSMYLAAYSGDPRSSGVELTASNGYARIAIGSAYGTAAASGAIANSLDLTWPAATGSWTTPWDHIGFIDASTGGNLWWLGASTSRTVINGQKPVNRAGFLGLSFGVGMGTYFANLLLNCLCRGANVSGPGAMYLAPYYGDPLAGGTELTTNGATRIAIPSFAAPSSGSSSNTSSVAWSAATGDWVNNFDHVAYVDASSSGNIWAGQSLTEVETVLTGDVLTVPIGGITVAFS